METSEQMRKWQRYVGRCKVQVYAFSGEFLCTRWLTPVNTLFAIATKWQFYRLFILPVLDGVCDYFRAISRLPSWIRLISVMLTEHCSVTGHWLFFNFFAALLATVWLHERKYRCCAEFNFRAYLLACLDGVSTICRPQRNRLVIMKLFFMIYYFDLSICFRLARRRNNKHDECSKMWQ